MLFRFRVPVCGYRVYEVEADTEEEARLSLIEDGAGEELDYNVNEDITNIQLDYPIPLKQLKEEQK